MAGPPELSHHPHPQNFTLDMGFLPGSCPPGPTWGRDAAVSWPAREGPTEGHLPGKSGRAWEGHR